MSSTYSIQVPPEISDVHDMLPFAALTQWSNAFRLWQGHGVGINVNQAVAAMAANGFRVPIGLGVTPMPLRHPHEAALTALCSAVVMGHPFVAGFGPGTSVLQSNLLGAAYPSELNATREYIGVVRALLDGEVLDFEGEVFTCHAGVTQFPGPRMEVGAGVLRPAMARLAGEIADIAITSAAPVAYLRDVLIPEIRAGAQESSRTMPKVVAVVAVALRDTDRDAVELASISNVGRLGLPYYHDLLRRSGIAPGSTHFASALIDSGAFVFGDLDQVAETLAEYERIGVDDIVLDTSGVASRHGINAALTDLETILDRVSTA